MNFINLAPTLRGYLAVCTAVMACTAMWPASAQERWPSKPVTWVVGYAAGGSTDTVARLLAGRVSEKLGQTVVVENKSGANSNIAATHVANAPPDGYTFYVGTIANAINASLYKKLSYDFRKDFAPVALIATSPNVLVVKTSALPVKNVPELISHARANPGRLSYASSGSGSSIHLSAELFKKEAKVHMVHIPYRGSSPAITDLLGGQVHLMFDNLPSALPHIQSGRLRALGVTSGTRSPIAPDIPTIAESGLPNFNVEAWFALFAPTNTPIAIQAEMAAATRAAIQLPDVKARMRELGAVPGNATPAQLRAYIDSEIIRWAEVVKFSGATVE